MQEICAFQQRVYYLQESLRGSRSIIEFRGRSEEAIMTLRRRQFLDLAAVSAALFLSSPHGVAQDLAIPPATPSPGYRDVTTSRQAPDARVADLVQAGKVRVAIGLAPIFANRDPTGKLSGVAVDLANALAARIGIELLIVEYPRPGAVLEGLRAGEWDVAFQGIDPSRSPEIDFTTPYMQVDLTFLVPASSAIHKISDADEPGVTIAVPRGDLVDILLSRAFKQAKLVRADSVVGAFDLLRSGQADVCALPLPNLLDYRDRLPDSRIVEDRFGVNFVAMAVPKGRTGPLAYVQEFIEEAKASGLLQEIIDRSGLRGVKTISQ
jgi:polar amino acid transport system substrate-binding protein